MSDLLTLIVPLLDRHKLTNRVLDSLDKQSCEFKIIIADGSQSQWSGEYKNLDIEYFYNGFDHNIAQYMNKMYGAFQRVKTPLSMVFDNDDLVDLAGIRNGIHFLSEKLEYSTYRNDVRPLHLTPKIQIDDSLYTEASIEQEQATDRLRSALHNFNSFNFSIFRTPIVKCFFEILDALNNDDFQLFQKGWAYISAIFGKCKRLHNESYYYFIPGDSILQNNGKVHKFSNWMNTKHWETAAPTMISMVATVFRFLHNKDIRYSFADAFVSEVCRKNNIMLSDESYFERCADHSFHYDPKISGILDKYSFEYQKFDYKKQTSATHKEFLKSLST